MSIIARPAAAFDAPSQLALAARLAELLGEEHEALAAGDTDAVAALAAAKEKVLDEFRTIAREPRRDATSRGHDRALFVALDALGQANAANGQLATARLGYVRARYAGLLGAASAAAPDDAGTYRANGLTGVRTIRHPSFYGQA